MLGAAVWGAGWVSGEHLKAYIKNPQSSVVAIGCRTKEKARLKADELDLKVDVYDDLEEMLARTDLDVVSICTPHHLHVQNLIKVAEAGKHCMIEKPLALSVDELCLAYDIVRKTKIKTHVGFELPWNPYVTMINNLIKDGTIGDIVFIEAGYFSEQGPWWPGFEWGITKKYGGTVISVAGCHAVDLLVRLGGPVEEVFAYHTRRNRLDYEYEPTITGVLKFQNGIVGSVSSSFEVHAPYTFPIIVGGSKGSIREGKLHADRFAGQTAWIDLPTIMPDTPDVTHHPFCEEIDHFIDCILNDIDSSFDVISTGHGVEVGLALDISAETGQPVKLPLVR